MTEPTLLDFYLDILETAGFQVNDDFFIMHRPESEKKKPEHVMVMDKKLVLPAPILLKNPDPENNVFFHPLCEQILRGESEVFTFLKRAMVMRLILSYSSLGAGLTRLHTDINLQKSMSIKQIEYIKDLVDVDEKTLLAWTGFIWGHIKLAPHDSTKWPIRMYIKQSGRYEGKNYQRVCSVAFPLIERLLNEKDIPKPGTEDQKYRSKDYLAFKQISGAIFPESIMEHSEAYNSGYSDTFAANLMAFLLSYKKLAERINVITETLREPLERAGASPDAIHIPVKWMDYIDEAGREKLALLNRRIPALPGNMGVPANRAVPSEESEQEQPRKPVSREATPSPRSQPQEDTRASLREKWKEQASDTPPWEDSETKKPSVESKAEPVGTVSFRDIMKKNPALERSTRAADEYEERERGARRGGWRDRDRYEDDDRGGYDRGYRGRSRYDNDRDYNRSDDYYDRGYGRGRRDNYDDRDRGYGRRESYYGDRGGYPERGRGRSLYGDPAPRGGYRRY